MINVFPWKLNFAIIRVSLCSKSVRYLKQIVPLSKTFCPWRGFCAGFLEPVLELFYMFSQRKYFR